MKMGSWASLILKFEPEPSLDEPNSNLPSLSKLRSIYTPELRQGLFIRNCRYVIAKVRQAGASPKYRLPSHLIANRPLQCRSDLR